MNLFKKTPQRNTAYYELLDEIERVKTQMDANITVSGGLITCSDAEFTIYNTLGQDVTVYNGSLQPGIYVVSIAEDVVKVMMK